MMYDCLLEDMAEIDVVDTRRVYFLLLTSVTTNFLHCCSYHDQSGDLSSYEYNHNANPAIAGLFALIRLAYASTS